MNDYTNLKERHQKDFDDFPMAFAFSDKQFNEGMKKLGLDPSDTDKVCSIPGGGIIRITDAEALGSLFVRQGKEMRKAIDEDLTGKGFIYEMFRYELANHEYIATYDVSDTLNALGLTSERVANSFPLSNGLAKAIEEIEREHQM